ncbi:MAG: phosphoglycerate kinase [Pyrodictiaceae archaeon]
MPILVKDDIAIATLDDLDEKYGLNGKKILTRIDINCPIDPKTGKILDDTRIRAHVDTIRELVEKNASVVLISHQGRPGEDDFVSLERHAELLSKYLGMNINFIDDVIGPAARNAIRELGKGEVLLLDNVRLVSEEIIEALPEKHASTILVKRLYPLFDLYVNDAFATAHRSQPSIVGFPLLLPSAAGRLFEKEVKALAKIFEPGLTPRIFVLGGGKVHDTLRIIEYLTVKRIADRILTTGLVAELFLVAKNIDIGELNKSFLERKGLLSLIPRARRILLKGAPIETPIDFVTEVNDKVKVESVGSIKGLIRDIGPETLKMFKEFIGEAELIVLRGPAGVIEDPRFRKGTRTLVEAALESKAYLIIGGGHLNAIMAELGDKHRDKMHISTAGGALLLFLAGEELPAIRALNISFKKFLLNSRSNG